MKEYLGIIFLAVFCFGQNVPSGTVPALPSVPDTNKVNGVPSTPNTNNINGVFNTPTNSVPAVPSTPNTNKENAVPSTPNNTNNVNGALNTPGNSVPAVPSTSNTNKVYAVPSTPNTNNVNGVLNTPSNSVPAVPSTPDTNKVNDVPSTPNTTNVNGDFNTPSTNIPSNAIPSSNGPAVLSTPGNIPVVSNLDINSVVTNVPLLGVQSKIERPCQPYDKLCIRRYFLNNSHCKPAIGFVPDPLYRTLSNHFYPRVNITNTNLNIRNRGFNNASIEEFYINRETDKLVMGILFQGLSQASNDSFFRYHRRGKEPIITRGYVSVTFNSLYVTAIIPQVENLRLDRADVFAFSDDLIPKIELDPKLAQSSDPEVPRMFAEFLSNIPVDVAEFLLTESAHYAAAYIQYVICDFGLELV